MPQYLNGINVTSLSLGINSGSALTTGNNNLLLGANAGRDLTTASNNVILGSYQATSEPTLQPEGGRGGLPLPSRTLFCLATVWVWWHVVGTVMAPPAIPGSSPT